MLLRSSNSLSPSTATIPVTIHLPRSLWESLQLCTPAGGDVAAVLVEAVEHYLARAVASRKPRGRAERLLAALSRPITSLGLGPRAERALRSAGIAYTYDLVGKTRPELAALRGCGAQALREIQDAVTALGLDLGMALDAATSRAAVLRAHLAARRVPSDEPER